MVSKLVWHDVKPVYIRIRENGKPHGTGTTMLFEGDDLDGADTNHETAIDKVARWIALSMDNSGPTLAEWKALK